jgi:hypothetical protein
LRALAALWLVVPQAVAQTGELRHEFVSAALADEYGSSVAGAGDVDGDGVPDVAIGAPFSAEVVTHGGAAKIYSGATGGLIRSYLGTVLNQGLGLGLASAGDVDDDGTPDLLVGMSGNGSSGAGPGGGARVYSGATGAIIRSFGGTTFNDGFGLTLAGLGDINLDGFDDVIVGTAFPVGAAQPGYVKVFSGATGAVLYTKTGTFNGQRFGVAVGAAGDVNDDGVPDFIIGAIGNNPNGSNSGSAFVYSGATGALIHAFHGAGANHLFGYGVDGVGDVNGDGHDDVIVGSYLPSGIGYARVHSGATGAVLHTLTDGVVGDAFGHTVAGIGDVNGDGVPDFGVAAPNSGVNGTLSGFVRFFSGADGATLKDVVGPGAGMRFGYNFDGTGDVNGDALRDVVIGTLVSSGSGFPGRARVVSQCAAVPYGVGVLPTQTMTSFWITGAPGHEAEGGVGVFGGTPGGPGLVALSVAPAFYVDFGVPILIDPAPGAFALFDVLFDGTGYFEAPVSLRSPSLAGVSLYTQTFEANGAAPQGFYASNGLILYFGN